MKLSWLIGQMISISYATLTMTYQSKYPAICCIMFFCQLTAISATALLNTTAEAASDNREFTRVFHQIISLEFDTFSIASDLLDISNPHEYADTFVK